jgi:hypothetical protein
MTANPRIPRDQDAWAHPVQRLTTTASGAPIDTVTGRRVAGPVQGFGQMWQKTFTVRLEGVGITPEELVAQWKAAFATFWPKGARFYAPLSGIAPGEVALLEIPPLLGAPIRMSTGVMVIYADDQSFTFMTPEGHGLLGLATFSAFRDGDTTVAPVQTLERTADPIIELTYLLGANRFNDRHWLSTLENLARSVGVASPTPELRKVVVDRRRQWRSVTNLRFSPAFAIPIGIVTSRVRSLRRRLSAR